MLFFTTDIIYSILLLLFLLFSISFAILSLLFVFIDSCFFRNCTLYILFMTAFTIVAYSFHPYIGSVHVRTLSSRPHLWGLLHICHCFLLLIMNEHLVRGCCCMTLLLLWLLGKFEANFIFSLEVFQFFCIEWF